MIISPSARWHRTNREKIMPIMVSAPSSLLVVFWRLSRSSVGCPISSMFKAVPLYIKTAYHEEPSFANTKVVTSLFPNNLKSNLGSNFKNCIEFREATGDLLAKYNDDFDYNELCKLAIDYSDGVIAAHKSINKELIKYAKDNNVPTLAYPGEDFADAYENFYEKI